MLLPSLPADAARLCDELRAPPLLVRHLVLVHHTAVELVDGLATAFPGLVVDDEAVLLGASLHDIGKVLHPGELVCSGRQHEDDGPGLLEQHGVPLKLARFSRTHGRWHEVDDIEDLLVAVADNIWRGRRVEQLETKVAAILAAKVGVESWAAWSRLDAVCEEIASKGEQRLAWQSGV
jgi:putative nucleotidyltransferase with HDIG domain